MVHHKSGKTVGDVIKDFVSCFQTNMSLRLKMQILSHIFKQCVTAVDGIEFLKFVNDYLQRSLGAMKTLFCNGKANIIYNLSKCFKGATPRMPLDRMPFGLLDYNIRFLASNTTCNLHMEEHYALWLETMFSHFGDKWLCLHRGRMWQYEKNPVSDNGDIIQEALQQSSISLDNLCSDDVNELNMLTVDFSLCDLSADNDTISNSASGEGTNTSISLSPPYNQLWKYSTMY